MSRTGFAFLMVGLAVAILALMWLGWRARAKRDAGISLAAGALAGALIAEFTGVQYISTTPLGRALERASIPGLRFKGLADIALRADGVQVSVTGEPTVSIPAADLLGTSRASGRVGKAVETGGIAVLEWRTPDGHELESGFRFSDAAQQREFEGAIARLMDTTKSTPQTNASTGTTDAGNSSTLTDTTQEDA